MIVDYRMIGLLQFQALVESTGNDIATCQNDLTAIYRTVGLDITSTMSLRVASDKVRGEIRSQFLWNRQAVRRFLQKLQQALVVEFVTQGKNWELEFAVTKGIIDSLNDNQTDVASGPVNWPEIVRLAKMLVELNPDIYLLDESKARLQYRKAFAYADASKRLLAADFEGKLEEGVVVFDETERRKIASNIERRIEQLGGFYVASRLFKRIERLYSPEMQRYLLGMRFDTFLDAAGPVLPIGYLLNLCTKHLESSKMNLNAITPLVTHNLNSLFVGSNGLNNLERQGVEREEQLRQLYNISTDFATNYNAQPYSGWTLLTNDQFSLNEFLIDLALYDRFYSFAQFRASDIRETVIAVFSWITPAFEAKLQWTVQHAAHVVEALVSAQSPKLQPHVISIEYLLAACSEVPEAEFHRILDLLSYTNHGENEAILPEFSEALALTSKPLVKSKDGSYVLLATSVATASSIEPIAHDVYRHDRKAYEKIGLSIESFLRRRIEQKAIPVLSGIYRIAGQDGECDAIIETPETIIFLELKLKSLTRLARSGQDIEIFIDLSKSLFAALKQLNQHEILLRRHGKLQLKRNDGSTSQIDLNGRTIEKVALTFDDFGSFQDRNVLTQILGILMNVSLGTDKVERRSELEKLNIQVAAIRKQIATLQELNPAMSKIPFFNCWFLSVPQLLTLLDEVSSPQSFKEELWSIRHVTHVSLDAYVELTAARQMRRSAH